MDSNAEHEISKLKKQLKKLKTSAEDLASACKKLIENGQPQPKTPAIEAWDKAVRKAKSAIRDLP